ncbi:MAG: phosphatidate cytidylyltransferase [SAR202 cluster bacterium]|nr:phosphatidate cytidylyltransferase [SAR202 cluster bacterium]|tara:strand:+ start:163 stop:990 length:828 start_codon:yes stop_codon:yes gene_type:complete
MQLRIITATLGIPVVFLILWAGYPWIWIAFSIVSTIAILEFYNLNPNNCPIIVKIIGVCWLNMLLSNGYILHLAQIDILMLGLVGIPTVNFLLQIIVFCKNKFNQPFELKQPSLYSLHTLIGIIYIGIPVSLSLSIRNEANGFELLAIIIFGVFVTDTFSFLTGKLIGTRKLAPTISPGKTWEGAVGGFLFGSSFTIYLTHTLAVFNNFQLILLLGFALAISAQIGDLLESKLKRIAKVKDTGNLIPGHGGVLDRMDSIILTIVVLYPLIKWGVE